MAVADVGTCVAQSNPYGTLYGGPQAPSQQPHVPWAASPGHAPAQQPEVQAPLPAEPPLPGEPPLPQQPALTNGRQHQVLRVLYSVS
jgi:hypothetical protein